jgi:glycosyltransferase involved in cell wall biosynthesis
MHSTNNIQDQWNVLGPSERARLLFFLRRIPRIVVVGSRVRDLLLSLGIKPKRITEISAFIPPLETQEDFENIPAPTWNFVAEHQPVISTCAFQFGFYQGLEIYGVDMCIELCAELKKQYPRIGFVCAVPEIGDAKYFEEMQSRIKRRNIENNFHFILEPCEFYPLLLKSDVFVRPTCTDAYGVSIAEAIHFSIPAIASDVCERPQGTVLFKVRDQADFLEKVREVLKNPQAYRNRQGRGDGEGSFEKLLKLYERLGLHTS